jgi:hypothetical protein
MTRQASLAAEFVRPMNRDNGFFAVFGNHRDSEFAFMNVKNRIRRIALREDNLIFSISGYGLSFASLRKEGSDVESA